MKHASNASINGNPQPIQQLFYEFRATDLGTLLVAFSDQGIVAVFLGDTQDELLCALRTRFPSVDLAASCNNQWADQVARLVSSPASVLECPLDIRGTPFQQRVWKEIQKIAPGDTATYSDIAQRIAAPTAVRAVASACAKNNIALAIPCHRVIRRDGKRSGYAWGAARKAVLLEREALIRTC